VLPPDHVRVDYALNVTVQNKLDLGGFAIAHLRALMKVVVVAKWCHTLSAHCIRSVSRRCNEAYCRDL
jgi:hypothetical protein